MENKSKTCILTHDDLKHIQDSKIIVDVSLPRCVDPTCDTIPGMDVISVDKLEGIANTTMASRRAVIPHVQACIRVAISELNDWMAYRSERFEWVNSPAARYGTII